MAVTNHTSGKWQGELLDYYNKVSREKSLIITISTFCLSVSAAESSFFPTETHVILSKVFHGLL